MMLAAISHDLRSPLSRIRMAAELLSHAQEMPVRREAILRNVDVANRLLTSFIDMAYAEEEPIEGSVNLRTLTLSVAAAIPGVRLVELPEEEVWLAPASSVALERALRNLIDNAVVHGQPPI
jgi:two-component system, OmpR family, osmolarity sensor histidine kinase EnvZ